MTQYGKTKKTLDKHKLAPSKRFGQNFLVNRNTAEAIVHAARVTKKDMVVEVGVGLGALTAPLAHCVKHVFGLEIDSGIIRFHQQENNLPENVSLLHDDVLKTNFQSLREKCGSRLKIIANLPYSISNPFIFKLIDNRDDIESATIMLQKEVAERLMAVPGTKEYGIPTILLQTCATIEKCMTLKPGEFHPRPKVDSVVIRLLFHPRPERVEKLPQYDGKLLQQIVRAAFGNRRKTLLNTMNSANLFRTISLTDKNKAKKITENIIVAADLSPKIRGEMLSLEDFVRLTTETQMVLLSYS